MTYEVQLFLPKDIEKGRGLLMTKKKKCLIILLICLGCIGAAINVMLVAGLPWTIILIDTLLSEDPPLPDTTYLEFPFEIIYKINEETVTISDVYICEYDGIEWDLAQGKYRTWKGYVKSTGENAIFITEDDEREVYCLVGDASYYMNDKNKYQVQRPLKPRLYVVKKNGNPDAMLQSKILELYNIEILSWTFSDPLDPALINN